MNGTAKRCDNASVGVLAERDGRWLFIWRNTFPFSVAPVSGHVFDDHASYRDAAVAEMEEEAGLTVEALFPAGAGGWRPNRCRREPGPAGTGHLWEVYTATVSGDLAPSPREVRAARWLSAPQMQLLANRTLLRAHGRVSDGSWDESPGIEPVWTGFLATLGMIRMSPEDLSLVEACMAEGRSLAS